MMWPSVLTGKDIAMTALNIKNPTLADVRLVIGQSAYYPEAKRKRIDNALRSVWRYSGRRLEEIPATMTSIREVIDSIEPAMHDIKRPTLLNVRGLVLHAMAKSGLVPAVENYKKRRKPLSPTWAIFMSKHISMAEHNGLWSFVHFSNELDIEPSSASDKTFADFQKHMEETSPRANQHNLFRATAKHWNAIRMREADLNLQEITVPPSKLRRRSIPMSAFPASLRDDIKDYLRWASSEDVFNENARDVVLKKNTVENYERRFERAACVLTENGVAISDITSLGDLVNVENFRRLLRGLRASDKSAQHTETFGTAMTLLRTAKEWVRVDKEQLEKLEEIKRKLPRPKMVMTDKNKILVSQFDDPAVFERLVVAPNQIWTRLKKDQRLGGRSQLVLAQAAIGLEILLTMPLRLSNLTALSFGQHIHLRPHGTSSIVVPSEETKSGRPIEFDIPEALASKLVEYRAEIVPGIVGRQPAALFCGTDGVGKGFAQVRYIVQTYFKEYVGFHMNPHAFRHLCAKIILDADPGAHVMVQELLGHKNLQTAVAFYAGLNSRRAGRHHQELIAEAMAREKFNGKRRRSPGRA